MPDFAPNFTPRYIMRYIHVGVVHTMTLRGARGESETDVVNRGKAAAFGVLDAFADILFDDLEALAGFYIAEDTDFALPASFPTLTAGTVDPATASIMDQCMRVTFSGRSSLGSKARFSFFGLSGAWDTAKPTGNDDFRFTSTEVPQVADALAALAALDLAGIDNGRVTWYPQVTLKIDDHMVRLARKGAL